jgi:hypothetical protein
VTIAAVSRQKLSQACERVRASNHSRSRTAEAGRDASISVAKTRVSRDALVSALRDSLSER